MGVAEAVPELRDDVIYLDGELVRMEAEPWCGQVVLFIDHGESWSQAGVVIAADTADATVHVVPDIDGWIARGRNRARLTDAACDFLQAARRRR